MKTLPVILVGLMACFAIGVSPARGQAVVYSLEDLGVVEKMNASVSTAMNNQGYVTGTAYRGEETCAFHYDYIKKFMDDAGGVNSRGFGINSLNVVVGDTFPAIPIMDPRSHAALFNGGVAVDLGVLPDQAYSRANGINTTGQVVGYSGLARDGFQGRAFVWTSQTGMTDIGTLGGRYAQAYAINDAGFITGTAQTLVAAATTHAFIYCQQCAGPAAMRDLGVLGGNVSYGMAINNYNHVVGYSTIKANDERVHAFLYNGNKMIDLGSLGGPGNRWGSDNSVALGVNNKDDVVGYTYLPVVGEMPIQQVAFLWQRGQMINLNTLLYGNGKNYLVFSATAINDNGQIAASAYYMPTGNVRAVMLTPTGAPLPP